ncbi:hypothetical protein ACFSTA_03790 [Ornithinibacillus salinisoli]|uniref:Uncharacterized protein n=1 Tax=Ornithinibacillus salinisoli TaxID=1848459 RepID=A0ABW4VUZ2_9BACI
MSRYQKANVLISLFVLLFFLTLSIITSQWGFFLWSLLPIFIVNMTAFTNKKQRN